GRMKKGVLVRHLVLPGGYRDSINILEYLAEKYQSDKLGISLMCQYFPGFMAKEYPELNRRITSFEYKKVIEKAEELGFVIGFVQDRSSATDEYVPSFDYK
ncbi:MAG: radical SAM protein, partial [Clostridia bacterium]|nr:radical SAM protein [Clostridia bacterium]